MPIWEALKEAFSAAFDEAKRVFIGIGKLVGRVFNFIKGKIRSFIDSDIGKKFIGGFRAARDKVVFFIKAHIAAFKGLVSAGILLVKNIINNFGKIPSLVMEALRGIPHAFINIFKDIGAVISAILDGDFKKIPDLLKSAGKNILKANPLTAIGISLGKEFGKGVTDEFGRVVRDALQPKEPIEDVKDSAKEAGEELGNEFGDGFTEGADLDERIKNMDKDLEGIRKITTPLTSAVDGVTEAFNKLDAEAEILGTDRLETLKGQQSALQGGLVKLAEAGLQGSQAFQDMSAALKAVNTETDTFTEKAVVNLGQIATQQIQQFAANGIAQMGEFIGVLAAGGGEAGNFGVKIMQAVSGFLGAFGKALISAGVAALVFDELLISPQAAIVAGIALVALSAGIKTLLKKGPGGGTPSLAEGGLAFGPTLAIVGDNPGANPEVIAPLDKLQGMMGGGTLEARISGEDLVFLLDRTRGRQGRTTR